MIVRLTWSTLYEVVNYKSLLVLPTVLALMPVPIKGKKALLTPYAKISTGFFLMCLLPLPIATKSAEWPIS